MKIVQYFKESYTELRLVEWPKRRQVVTDTTLVAIISLVFAAFLGSMDLGLNFLLQLILGTR